MYVLDSTLRKLSIGGLFILKHDSSRRHASPVARDEVEPLILILRHGADLTFRDVSITKLGKQ